MAARPGEDLAATLFADIHYYYGPPTTKPPHHRFDKGSYVYLFENASQRRARIEVANNAGTADQDAFDGYLDGAHVQYSYKHSTLVSLTVGAQSQRNSGAPADSHEWHLPTFDPRNEKKYMYKLHTIDIYFWTKEDALQFVNGVRRVLPQHQITVQDEPIAPPPHVEDMSPVVQKLESVAITDPSYQHGRTRDSRTTSTSFPGPPISATPHSQEASNFAPLAYNPAAPAAPEAIKHREKTPPPEDGAPNPLAAAAASDHGQTYGVPFQNPGGFSGPPSQPPPQHSYFPGPPAAPVSALPPPQPTAPAAVQSPYAQHFQHSFAPPPTAPTLNSSPYASNPTNPAPGPPPYTAPGHVPVTQYYPGSPGMSPGMSSPGMASPGMSSPGMNSPGFSSPGIYSPASPPGGFAQFNYAQGNPAMSNTKPLMTDYSIHQQVYRPTENEAALKHNKPVKPPRGKLEERAGQLEKGVGGFLKKLEKKYG